MNEQLSRDIRTEIVNNIRKRYPKMNKILIYIVAGEFIDEITRRLKRGIPTKIGNFFDLKYVNKKERKIYQYGMTRPEFIEPKLVFNYKFKKYANDKIKQNIKNHMEKYGTEF